MLSIYFAFLNCITSFCKVFYFRYQSLHDPVQIRRENLEDSLLLHQFNRDVEDELSWISEKEPLAASSDLGNNLVTVQNLQKKHQVCSF